MTQDYTVKEVAVELNCSEKLIRKMIKAGTIKHYKVGRLIRIPTDQMKKIRQLEAG